MSLIHNKAFNLWQIPVEDVLTTSTSAPVAIQSGSGNATQRMVLNKNDEIRVKVHAGKG